MLKLKNVQNKCFLCRFFNKNKKNIFGNNWNSIFVKRIEKVGKNKLKRFAANDINPNVVQEGKAIYTTIKGKWNSDFFTKNQPITLEIGCGNGEYTVGLAQHFGERNFIGCDIKGARIFKGSTEASEKNLQNVGFLRCRVEFILEFFEANEIDQIWITFPDPQLKDNREKHRLTHPRFLDLYKKILKPDGFIHLKTDSRELADFTLETLKTYPHHNLIHTFDLYHSALIAEHQGIQTKYERMFLGQGKTINYIKFQLK